MFQEFDPPPTNAPHAERLAALRDLMRRQKLDAFLVPRSDRHQGEYVADCDERLKWLTGFSGSAGLAIVAIDKAALFVDGRYTLQAPAQIDTTAFDVLQIPEHTAAAWVRDTLGPKSIIGFDPWLHTIDEIARLKEAVKSRQMRLTPRQKNPIDKLWGKDQPKPPNAMVKRHLMKYAGLSPADKIAEVQKKLTANCRDAVILTMPDSICWIFNIRGGDIPRTPVVHAFAIIHRRGKAELFVSSAKIDADVRAHLKPHAVVRDPATLGERVKALKAAGKKVQLDTRQAAHWFASRLGGARKVLAGPDPCALPKARKNATELRGIREAHKRDGAALCRFLAWFDKHAPKGQLDEIAAVKALEEERRATGKLFDISFDTISGSGPNGAIVHYRVTEATNRPISKGELFLIDSGAQYVDGTTDVTRTIAVGTPSADMRRAFTAVLKGHIAIASARFPKGTRGIDLDPFARRALWQYGMDYAHGTGHGVGAFLSVHEGPASISKRGLVPLEPGMILSNEPGYYRAGAFGIRIENLLCVTPPQKIDGGDQDMLGFENLTLAPIDRHLIERSTLTNAEIAWLNAYHARVYQEIAPALNAQQKDWLRTATAAL